MGAGVLRSCEQPCGIGVINFEQLVIVIVCVPRIGHEPDGNFGVISCGGTSEQEIVAVFFLHVAAIVGDQVGVLEFVGNGVVHVLDLEGGLRGGRQEIAVEHALLPGFADTFCEGVSEEVDFVNVRGLIQFNREVTDCLADSQVGIDCCRMGVSGGYPVLA